MDESLLHCPFCMEADFDKAGLKWHLSTGRCEAFEATENLSPRVEFSSPAPSEADRRDAERYRRIRSGLPLTVIVPTPTDEKPNKKTTVHYGPNPEEAWGVSLDAAIDAALSASKEPRDGR